MLYQWYSLLVIFNGVQLLKREILFLVQIFEPSTNFLCELEILDEYKFIE
jgi:hypothetical protein